MSQEVIRVGMFYDKPYSYGVRNESNNEQIFHKDFVYLFCKTSNVTCEFHTSPDNDYGYFTNGKWHGMVKHISDGLFDLSFPYFTLNKERFEVIDFSTPVIYIPLILVTRKPDLSISSINLLSPFVFHWTAWILLILFSLVIGVLIAVYEINPLGRRFCFRLLTGCIDAFSFVTNQTSELVVPRLCVRFIIGFWAMSIVILCGIYCGKLTSSLIRSTSGKLPFNDLITFVDCLETSECQLVLHKEHLSFVTDIYVSDSPIGNRLKHFLENHHIFQFGSLKETLRQILMDKSRYLVAMMSHADYLMSSNFNVNCLYSWVQFGTDVNAFPFRKNSTFKETLNLFVERANQAGIFSKVYSDMFGVEQECLIKQYDNLSIRINLIQFLGCLFVLLIGIIVSASIFSVEIFKPWFWKNSKKFEVTVSNKY